MVVRVQNVIVSPARSTSAAEEHLEAELSAQNLSSSAFDEFDPQAPIDIDARIADTPPAATAKGMFFETLAKSARKFGVACEPRYVPFRDYPLRDFMRLLADYGRARYPSHSIREAMRRAGWEAFPALMSSVAGRVLYAFAGHDVQAALRLAPQAYKHSLSHCSVTARVCTSGQAVLELRDVWNFPECYQVGVIEGGCRAYGTAPRVRVRIHSHSSVDLLVRWNAP
jgi:uncharacterized protein (TIGR02265 family)